LKAMTPKPLIGLPLCNRCGECCKKGGACVFRTWDGSDRKWEFEGRCELLEDQPDGSTLCKILSSVQPEILSDWVNGECDFPEWRKELVSLLLVR